MRIHPLTLLLFALVTTPLSAADAKPEEKKDAPPAEAKEETTETQRSITVKGQKLSYRATAGTMTLTKAYGEPRAKVFSVSYERTDAGDSAKRPVCFCFNGGPGSSAVWLHLGAFGPRRVSMPPDGVTAPRPPFQLTENEHTLLRDADLVFVDPVSTGLSQPEKGEDPKQFHGFSEDIESVGDFVRLWITKRQRWGSPKFLMGESYGAIRISGLAEHLQSRYGMYLNGVIIVSGLLDFRTLSPDEQNDVPFHIWLPSMTAVAHYHRKLTPELQADFAAAWKRSVEFSRDRYPRALLMGADLPEQERRGVADYLSLLTGLPSEQILRDNLRIDPSTFRRELLKSEDKVVGRFDGRCSGPEGDPSYDVVYGAFAAAMNAYLRGADGLNYASDRPYEILNGGVNPWNYGRGNRYFDVGSQLGGAMKQNPALRVFIGCGYHDLATPPEGIAYSVRHLDLPAETHRNFTWGYYDGGHMMYTNLESLAKISADISAFLNQP